MDLFFKTSKPLHIEDIEIRIDDSGIVSYFVPDVLFFGSHKEE